MRTLRYWWRLWLWYTCSPNYVEHYLRNSLSTYDVAEAEWLAERPKR